MVGAHKLLLLLLIFPAHWMAGGKLEIFLTKVKCEILMPSFINNLTCVLRPNKLDPPGLDMDFVLARDMHNISASLSIEILRGKSVMNYKIRLDFCTGLTALHNHYIARIIDRELREYGNIPFSCPFEKNKHYYTRDFRVNGDSFPKYIPELNFTSTGHFYTNERKVITMIHSGRVVKVRATTHKS